MFVQHMVLRLQSCPYGIQFPPSISKTQTDRPDRVCVPPVSAREHTQYTREERQK
ncbi:hypothetical protein K431DRAFT_289462 [Polychaeton citri CBS 116435]|uniref:Uncharacterized protein n=1 Tax=Polychaeton citri CBS 116435 TaxID=1314669 RepID=A0A9P4UK42_9PEZI|nr:hypothetical protein K431DRAFT_289462 [Polychaeton citri CBS 116435]